jgi:hypothetical protein
MVAHLLGRLQTARFGIMAAHNPVDYDALLRLQHGKSCGAIKANSSTAWPRAAGPVSARKIHVNDPKGLFTSDELAHVHDAVVEPCDA